MSNYQIWFFPPFLPSFFISFFLPLSSSFLSGNGRAEPPPSRPRVLISLARLIRGIMGFARTGPVASIGGCKLCAMRPQLGTFDHHRFLTSLTEPEGQAARHLRSTHSSLRAAVHLRQRTNWSPPSVTAVDQWPTQFPPTPQRKIQGCHFLGGHKFGILEFSDFFLTFHEKFPDFLTPGKLLCSQNLRSASGLRRYAFLLWF